MAEALASNGTLRFLDLRGNALLTERAHATFGALFDARPPGRSELAVHVDGLGKRPKRHRKKRQPVALEDGARAPEHGAEQPRKSGLFMTYTEDKSDLITGCGVQF